MEPKENEAKDKRIEELEEKVKLLEHIVKKLSNKIEHIDALYEFGPASFP